MPDGDSVGDNDGTSPLSRLLETDLLGQYRSSLEASLGHPTIESEFDAWRAYVAGRHGDVFTHLADDSSVSAAAQKLFVDTLTFDFLLTRLLDAVEDRFDCTVARPLAADASVPFDADFASVHEVVAAEMSVPAEASAFRRQAVECVGSASPYDVASLYRESVSLRTRRAFGRYDTPRGLAELAVQEVFERSAEGGRASEAAGSEPELRSAEEADSARPADISLVVDPGCGAGAFLGAAAARLVAEPRDVPATERIRTILDSVRGFDIAPSAVRASRLALILAVRPLLEAMNDSERATEGRPTFTPRVVLGDAAEATPDSPPLDGERADALLMNPPWLTWDSLSETVKDRWRTDSGDGSEPALFGHRGLDARLGYANDDLSVPYALRCVHRLLRDGGRASLILKRDLLTGPAGERLRRSDIGGRSIVYDRVHDFGSLAPFAEVDAGTALFALRMNGGGGRSDASGTIPTEDGIPLTRWSTVSETNAPTPSRNGVDSFESLSRMRSSFARTRTHLVPAEPGTPSSPWLSADAERAALGTCTYRIRHGVKDDAKAVYAVDEETIERHGLESDHVYPYLKSKHIVKYGLFGHDLQLVPQRRVDENNEDEIRRETPATYAYLDAHRDRLLDRGSSWFDGEPFYSLFGIGPYTWAEYKVVWCRLGFKPHFAVVSTVSDSLVGDKPVVPGDHCMFVATDDEREAHYLCALLNSAPYQRCLRDISSGGKASLSKSTVERLALPEWDDSHRQRRLASLSQRAHSIVPEHTDCSKRAYNTKTIPELASVQHEIDRTAERFLVADADGGV